MRVRDALLGGWSAARAAGDASADGDAGGAGAGAGAGGGAARAGPLSYLCSDAELICMCKLAKERRLWSDSSVVQAGAPPAAPHPWPTAR